MQRTGAERGPLIPDRRIAARISVPAARRRGPGARMARRNLVRRSSPAASSRAARRTLSSAYRGRSPDHCPVAFSFATAWFKLTPIRRTSSAARSSACTASRSGASGGVTAPRATARVASAAYAPRASPACRAAADTSAYSSSVSANRTVRARRTWCRVRRRGRAAGPLAVVATLVIAENVRHEPFPFSPQARRECAVNFPP